MKKRHASRPPEPTVMMHHIKELQLRFLVVGLLFVVGGAIGYIFYEQLFAFLRTPLDTPLHYTSPAGSFNLVVKICLMVGVFVMLPLAVYNLVMFIQPALREKLSRLRVYATAFSSLILASVGAAFGFFIIIPLALKFFFKFQVDGLVALISADEYLRFVVSVVVTFMLIFQLPLIMSFIDHISPLSPKKLFKAEKYIVIGSLVIALLVPFALDPAVQFMIASPIIILYNLSIGIILLQRKVRQRKAPVHTPTHSSLTPPSSVPAAPPKPAVQPRRSMDVVKQTTN
jgi:sec-independent protein translocase protein TatC